MPAPARLASLLMALGLAAAGAAEARAEQVISEAGVRAFLARQDRAWSRGELSAYFATFAPDAVFVDQAQNPRGGVLPYGRSSLAEARAQARRSRAAGDRSRQQTTLERLQVQGDGRTARVVTRDLTTVEHAGRSRRACAVGEQTLTLSRGRLVSHGLTETSVRCPK